MADFVADRLAKSTENIGAIESEQALQRAMSWSLYDSRGRRKYLVASERSAFLREAMKIGGSIATFCAVLVFCGPRISEALALTHERIDFADSAIVFETLKRRERGIMRAVPVPAELLALLEAVHESRAARCDAERAGERLWPWSRTTAWRKVREVMARAEIPPHLRKPKALRHGFGAAAATNSVVITLIKKWLGHAKLETTEHYTMLLGNEERVLAKSTWRDIRDELKI